MSSGFYGCDDTQVKYIKCDFITISMLTLIDEMVSLWIKFVVFFSIYKSKPNAQARKTWTQGKKTQLNQFLKAQYTQNENFMRWWKVQAQSKLNS